MAVLLALVVNLIVSYSRNLRLLFNKDELFGLDRLKETMANHSGASALAIQTAVLDRLNQFRGQTGQEDDVTLVVVKLL